MKYSLFFAFLILAISCQNLSQKEDDNTKQDTITVNDLQNYEEVKKIFYNVPSPVEMVSLVQNAGAVYNKSLLNPYKNVDTYITTEDLALNLGVYGADLSYNRIFDQMQESIKYLAAIQKIVDELKIPQEEGSFAVSKFEENLENRDSLLQIISDTYANADIYLKESNRESTAALIILGGWVEALYIATHLIDEENPDKGIMETIAQQKYPIQHINKMIAIYEDSSPAIEQLLPKMLKLEEVYDKIQIEYQKGEVKTDAASKSTTFGGKSIINVDYTNILEIKNIITEIRNEVIGNS